MRSFILIFLTVTFLNALGTNHYPFDKTKLSNYTPDIDLQTYVGSIKNQVWIASKKFNRSQLEKLVKKEYHFKIIGYYKVYGLLIEYDDMNKKQQKVIERIKTLKGVDNVFNRVYEGHNAPDIMK